MGPDENTQDVPQEGQDVPTPPVGGDDSNGQNDAGGGQGGQADGAPDVPAADQPAEAPAEGEENSDSQGQNV